MDRHQLEDQIRASLQSRADDVRPTPELWERVSTRTRRAARWQLGGWVLSGAAAVAAVVVGGIVLLGGPRSVEIAPEPDVMDTPTTTEPTEDATTDAVPGAGTPTVVTTDGATLYRVDATTGQVVQELFPFEGFGEGVAIRELAVRPVSDEGVVTVAMVIEVEGTYDVEIAAFDADGQRAARKRVAMGVPATDLPPDLVWSPDGRYVMWAGSSLQDGQPAGPGVWAYDWVAADTTTNAYGEPVSALPPEAAAPLFARGDVVDLREWTGATDGPSTVVATTTTGGAHRLDLTPCDDVARCVSLFGAEVGDLGFEGMSAVDLGTTGQGVNLALVVRSGPPGDAEGATLALVADPMSDQQEVLEVPELSAGTASPGDAWMAVAGNRVAIGFDAQASYLLALSGDTVEAIEVVDTVGLPDGTAGAAMAVTGRPAPATEPTPATPTEGPDDPTIGVDGLATHVITNPERDRLQLVDRRAPEEAVASWTRPADVDGEAFPAQVVVHPSSTPTDLEVVTRWTVGESDTFVRTAVRDGQVVVDEVMDVQPDNSGGAAESADVAPVFSPDGTWLAWVEAPRGGDGSAQVRFVPWGADGPTAEPQAALASDDSTRPVELLDWAVEGDAAVLTLRPAAEPGSDAQAPTSMIELRLPGGDPRAPAPVWTSVDLPGVVFDAGSFRFEDGSERYIAYAGGDEVLYALAEAPGTGVATGAFAFSEGRVVSFGPDNALVQTAGGSWQRVQVDDGAASTVSMPEATVAVLPWGTSSGG